MEVACVLHEGRDLARHLPTGVAIERHTSMYDISEVYEEPMACRSPLR